MVIDLTIQTYILLFITGLCSELVDSIAGVGKRRSVKSRKQVMIRLFCFFII